MEYSGVGVIESTVTISLPEWICDDEFFRRKVFYYPSFHAWKGSFDRSEDENMIVDELLSCIRGAKNVMSHPMNCNVEVELDESRCINDIIDEIHEILDRFQDKEYVKEVTKTMYFNKPE